MQPWLSSDGRWLLCYNGEIFNYRHLRAELIGLGREFRSESDTELALEAFLQWGEAAVRRFRGEFAFAITDRATGRTYLARDPVGVKPLYWSSRAWPPARGVGGQGAGARRSRGVGGAARPPRLGRPGGRSGPGAVCRPDGRGR